MLKEAASEEPPRTLQQRVEALTFAWDRAQDTFFKVNKEKGPRDVPMPPWHCSPYIPAHDQYSALQTLLNRASPSLWQVYCQNTDRRVKENPVHLLGYIMELKPEAHHLPVKSNEGKVHLRVTPGRHTEVYSTTGGEGGRETTTIPVADVKALERRALTFDVMAETNRVAYEATRQRGVNKDAYRFRIAFGHTHEMIQQRHDDRLCYFCGNNVRAAGGLLHTFWECPKKLAVDTEVQQKMRDQDRSEGATDLRNSQRQKNDRQAAREGSARQDAEQDTTYGRPPPRNQGAPRWASREPSSERRNNAYDDRATRWDSSRERQRDNWQAHDQARDPSRDRYPRGPYEQRKNGQRRDPGRERSRERPPRTYYDQKRDDEAAAPEPRERSRERQQQGQYGPPRTDENQRPRWDGVPRAAQQQTGRDPPTGQGRGQGRTYPARNQSLSEAFAQDITPNTPGAAGGTKQEKNARFANSTTNNVALEQEEEYERNSCQDTLSDVTA